MSTDLAPIYLRAAEVIRTNGLHQGDYVPDPFDREIDVEHALRPMSIVGALRFVTTGDVHHTSLVSDEAVSMLALHLPGDNGPDFGDIHSLEQHIEAWGDTAGRTDEQVIAALETAARMAAAVQAVA